MSIFLSINIQHAIFRQQESNHNKRGAACDKLYEGQVVNWKLPPKKLNYVREAVLEYRKKWITRVAPLFFIKIREQEDGLEAFFSKALADTYELATIAIAPLGVHPASLDEGPGVAFT